MNTSSESITIEQQLDHLLAAFKNAAKSQEQLLNELPVLDGRLRDLLNSDELPRRAAENEAAREQLIAQLEAIDLVHREVTAAAANHGRSIAERLQQLREDRRSANAYSRVRRHSL